MTLTTLVANAFIELNKKNNVKKIYLKDIINFNKALNEEAINNGLDYIGQLDSVYVYELRFKYSAFFNFYEDEDGYVITLKNEVTTSDIEKHFRFNVNKNFLLLLENIDINEIFGLETVKKYINF